MECPKCHAPMAKVTYESIEVDRCTKCQGIWFDMLEAEHLKKLDGSQAVDAGDPKVGRMFNAVADIECPACKTPMIRMVDAGQPHIWYEGCTRCYGLFFDAGEFTDYKEENILDLVRDLLARERK